MNTNSKFIITINRELGSGGRTVGRKLAEKLGVPYHDKTLIQALQERYNLTAEQIEQLKGHEISWWESFKQKMTEDVFRAETQILKALAKDQSCVIAGRTAFYMFRDHPNHLSVFIQASMLNRMERVAREQDMSKEQARLVIDKVDKMRENYVNEFTGTSRYDARNYHLVLSMDDLTEDAAVDLILQYIRSSAQE